MKKKDLVKRVERLEHELETLNSFYSQLLDQVMKLQDKQLEKKGIQTDREPCPQYEKIPYWLRPGFQRFSDRITCVDRWG